LPSAPATTPQSAPATASRNVFRTVHARGVQPHVFHTIGVA